MAAFLVCLSCSRSLIATLRYYGVLVFHHLLGMH
jgi:hypothetical protein